jgi:hypothetical protein
MTVNFDKTGVPARPAARDVALPGFGARMAGRRRQPRPQGARTAAAIIAMALTAGLGLAACGGGPSGLAVASRASTGSAQPASSSSGSSGSSSSSSSGSPAQQALAFARCMRRHGVTGFPDPNSSGNFPPSAKQISLSNPHQFQEARTACSDLLPNGGNGPTPAQWQQILSTMVEFAHCMRHHGVPEWPDPTYDTHGRPVFNINVDPNSPQFTGEIHACSHLLVNYGSRPGFPDLSNYFEQSQG